ncbi:hypothetical protein JADG_010975 [Aureobasidium aubasidani]|nr:hypothetical protein JADG_010975 [Aureobasidium pullulans]
MAETRSQSPDNMTTQPHRQQLGLACEECRRKRVRCDRKSPQCTACDNSGMVCIVRDNRPPRGPKKGYLKTLQKKIEELQTQLEMQKGMEQTQETEQTQGSQTAQATQAAHAAQAAQAAQASQATQATQATPAHGLKAWSPSVSPDEQEVERSSSSSSSDANVTMSSAIAGPAGDIMQWSVPMDFQMGSREPWECFDDSLASSFMSYSSLPTLPSLHSGPSTTTTVTPEISYSLPLALGEPDFLVTPMMHNDLDQLFYDRAYVFTPIIQRSRYQSWSKQANKTKQKICLQHAMWTFASSLSSQFHIEGQKLYSKTRQLLDSFESDTCCQELSIEHVQAWILLAIYELTGQNFHRGMVSAGRAFRLAHMMRLYELDIPPSPCAMQLRLHQLELNRQERSQSNWIETEVKRRTFWLAYLLDRTTSMVDGMHMSFDERVIRSRLPAPEANFSSGRPGADMYFLAEAMSAIDQTPPYPSAFREAIISSTICGRVLEHKQKPPNRASQEFCSRHRLLQAMLAQRIRTLRVYISLEGLDPVMGFVTLSTHIAILMLYDLIESRPMGSGPQAAQFTHTFYDE